MVLHQQVGQDALLLWRHTVRDDQVQLIAAAPLAFAGPEVTLAADEQVRQLSAGSLDLLAHLTCSPGDGQMDRALSGLGVQAALTTVLAAAREGAILLTAGFRQRWQLTAEHAPAVTAFVEYLQACQTAALWPTAGAVAGPHAWWELQSQAPALWQQTYRPSVLRTVHDLMETLSEAARALRPRFDPEGLPAPEVAHDLAHRAADLMDRLEGIYFGPNTHATFDELLSQALLLVRDAYHLCRGTWPGCLAVVRRRPAIAEGPAGDIRHQLIDWVAHHIESEHEAD